MAISKERLEELDTDWNYSELMDDDDYLDWYSELTDEEQKLIDAWDEQYNKGVSNMIDMIIARERSKKCEQENTRYLTMPRG